MQNTQVSIWIPIIVGVIGLIGVISGQLVNAWREDRRWRRDQAREVERERIRLLHASIESLRDTRLMVYGELLDHLNVLVETNRQLMHVGDDIARATDLRASSIVLLDNLHEFIKRSLLLADAPLLSLLRESMGEPLFAVPHPAVVDAARLPAASRQDAFIRIYKVSYEKTLSFYNAVLDECRKEVGVSPLTSENPKETK